jgi:choline dehydrogenase
MSADKPPTWTTSRRGFLGWGVRLLAGAWGLLYGCAPRLGDIAKEPAADKSCPNLPESADYEYIIVGSGAGGGPLAANLAKAGRRVLLLEAGGEEEPYNYQIPVFHPSASEDQELAWNFYVKHYADAAQQRRDEKYVGQRDGVLYPRAGTLGGCTAHHAMILVYPHNSDWDHIAALTGDDSWKADHMRRYFERMERCEYVDAPRDPGDNPGRHGFNGWLTTTVADPKLLIRDRDLLKLVKAVVLEAKDAFIHNIGDLFRRLKIRLQGHLDPNDWRLVTRSFEGICLTPLTVRQGKRQGAREYLRQVQRECPRHLTIQPHALASRVLFDDQNRAIGVEYLEGRRLYRADPRAPTSGPITAPRRTVHCTREVILCGGAFNTPQLLMLSGIGPVEELRRHGVEVRVDLPGVGRNLQDRYEVGVVSEMRRDFALLRGATFRQPRLGETPDPMFREWQEGRGVYTTNGAIIALMKRSAPSLPEPDLYLFGLAGYFKGYHPGYSERTVRDKNYFTWAILKAHTRNTAGRVTLRSNDPRDTPEINFHYFDEGTDPSGEDLESVVEGVEFARRIMARCADRVEREVVPGAAVQSRESIRRFIKDNAWGHHASCTCPIGPQQDRMAVLDSQFRVYGTQNLRVVDASVFPRIPGFFIVSAVYMVSEKASDVILAEA